MLGVIGSPYYDCDVHVLEYIQSRFLRQCGFWLWLTREIFYYLTAVINIQSLQQRTFVGGIWFFCVGWLPELLTARTCWFELNFQHITGHDGHIYFVLSITLQTTISLPRWPLTIMLLTYWICSVSHFLSLENLHISQLQLLHVRHTYFIFIVVHLKCNACSTILWGNITYAYCR